MNDSYDETVPENETVNISTSKNDIKQDSYEQTKPQNNESEYSRDKALELAANAIETLKCMEKTDVIDMLILNLSSIRRNIAFKANVPDMDIKAICEISISVLNNCADDPREIAQMVAERTRSQVVQVIGKKIVLYKESKDNKKIILP